MHTVRTYVEGDTKSLLQLFPVKSGCVHDVYIGKERGMRFMLSRNLCTERGMYILTS